MAGSHTAPREGVLIATRTRLLVVALCLQSILFTGPMWIPVDISVHRVALAVAWLLVIVACGALAVAKGRSLAWGSIGVLGVFGAVVVIALSATPGPGGGRVTERCEQ